MHLRILLTSSLIILERRVQFFERKISPKAQRGFIAKGQAQRKNEILIKEEKEAWENEKNAVILRSASGLSQRVKERESINLSDLQRRRG